MTPSIASSIGSSDPDRVPCSTPRPDRVPTRSASTASPRPVRLYGTHGRDGAANRDTPLRVPRPRGLPR